MFRDCVSSSSHRDIQALLTLCRYLLYAFKASLFEYIQSVYLFSMFLALLHVYLNSLSCRPFPTPPIPLSMSLPLKPIIQGALDAYAAACAQISSTLRHAFILINGAAIAAHGAPRDTEDVDVAVSAQALERLVLAAIIGRGGFRRYPDGTMTWDNGHFLVTIECLLLKGPFVPWISEVVGFRGGFKATLSELVRLRALTLVERGEGKDKGDLKLLLKLCASKSECLSDVDHEELEILLEAMTELREISKGYFMCIINVSTLHRYGISIV